MRLFPQFYRWECQDSGGLSTCPKLTHCGAVKERIWIQLIISKGQMFVHWILWLPDAHWVPGPLPGLSRGHEPISLLLDWTKECAGQLTPPGAHTGEPFPGDPVWAGLSVTREMSRIILPLTHLLSQNLSLSLCMHAYSVVQSCPTLCDPMDHDHQAPLSMDFPGKNTGAGCHFLL